MSARTLYHSDMEHIGRQAARRLERQVARSRAIRKGQLLGDPLVFRAVVTGTTRSLATNGAGVQTLTNNVTIRRTGQLLDDNALYPVWDAGYTPMRGDEVWLLALPGQTPAVIGARNGGRPWVSSVPVPGGTLLRTDSLGRTLSRYSDGHDRQHYTAGGAEVAHLHKATGEHYTIGDHYSIDKGSTKIAPNNAILLRNLAGAGATGTYVRRGVSVDTSTPTKPVIAAMRWINHGDGQGDVLVHQTTRDAHLLYTQTGRGTSEADPHTLTYTKHTHPLGHFFGDDGGGISGLKDPTSGPTLQLTSVDAAAALASGHLSAAQHALYYTWSNSRGESAPTATAELVTVASDGDQIVVPAISIPTGQGITGINFYLPASAADAQATNLGTAPTIRRVATQSFSLSATTTSPQTISAYPSGSAPLLPSGDSSKRADPDQVTPHFTLTQNAGAGSVPRGVYRIGYAWQYPWGTTAISATVQASITTTGQSLTITPDSTLTTLPTDATALNWYISPTPSFKAPHLALVQFNSQYVGGTGRQALGPFTLANEPLPAGLGSGSSDHSSEWQTPITGSYNLRAQEWPSANSTALVPPSAPTSATSSSPLVSSSLTNGTRYYVGYALYQNNDTSQHTRVVSSSIVVTLDGSGNTQAIVAGPVELPKGASGVLWGLSTDNITFYNQGAAIVDLSGHGNYTTALFKSYSTTTAYPAPANTTTLSKQPYNLVLGHGNGMTVLKHDTVGNHITHAKGVPHTTHHSHGGKSHHAPNGVTIIHGRGSDGKKAHTNDSHHMNGTGGIAYNSDGTLLLTGIYARRTYNAAAAQWEHYHHNTATSTAQRLHAYHYLNGHIHYDTDGTTVRQATRRNGDHHHNGDHVHGATLGADGALSGGTYVRNTVASGVYQKKMAISGTETLLHTHDGNDFKHYKGGVTMNTLTGGAGSGGYIKHTQFGSLTSFHLTGDDGSGKMHLRHAGGNKILDHDGTTITQYSGTNVAFQNNGSTMTMAIGGNTIYTHDGTNHLFWSPAFGSYPIKKIIRTSTNAGQSQIKQSNSANYHIVGDDDTGKFHVQHAAGHKVLDHDGTTLNQYAGNALAFQNTGTSMLMAIGGNNVQTHDGTNHLFWSPTYGAYPIKKIVKNATNGGQMLSKQGNSANYHIVGDDGTYGDLQAVSNSGTHRISVSGGASTHQHTADGHIHPSGAYVNAVSTDSSRIDILGAPTSGTRYGAIKQKSHSITTIANVYGPSNINTGSGNTFSSPGAIAPGGGSTGPANYFVKLQSVCVYDSSHANPGVYIHGGTNINYLAGAGVPVYQAGSPYTAVTWSTVQANADSSLSLYGQSGSGANFAVNVAVQTQMINV